MKTTIVLLCLLLTGVALHAQQQYEVITFKKESGWQIGDVSPTKTLYGQISVNISVEKSTLTGRHYYKVNIKNISDKTLEFGARLTDKYPNRSHFSVKVLPGKTFKWDEHLSSSAAEIYFLATTPK